jgi:pyruvate kinase
MVPLITPFTATMNVCLSMNDIDRLNFSHGSHEYHATTIARVKELTQSTRRVCAILLDTKGPEIRTGKLKGDKDIMVTYIHTIHTITQIHRIFPFEMQ